MQIREYSDPEAPGVYPCITDQRVSDAAYPEMVAKTVVSCADTVFTMKGDRALYLAKRCVYPMKGVWCFGGRILFNDRTIPEAIARQVQVETCVVFAPERFTLVGVHLYYWNKVAQGDFGGRNLAPIHNCQVTQDELDVMRTGLSPTEYDVVFGIRRYDRPKLLAERVHPAMRDVYDDLFPS